jgi:hypothetical protein
MLLTEKSTFFLRVEDVFVKQHNYLRDRDNTNVEIK